MMVFIRLADSPNAVDRVLVADLTAERVARVCRVNNNASIPDDTHCLPNVARLGIVWVNIEESGHEGKNV